MSTTVSHPTTAVLYAFHCGRLQPADQSDVESHVGGCGTCAGILARLPDTPLVLLAREAVRLASVTDPTPFPGSLRKSDL
ncbi:MAG: hypothetical protein U0871_18155 [Gemmataceae bacterium]